jgi:hypothetical protein
MADPGVPDLGALKHRQPPRHVVAPPRPSVFATTAEVAVVEGGMIELRFRSVSMDGGVQVSAVTPVVVPPGTFLGLLQVAPAALAQSMETATRDVGQIAAMLGGGAPEPSAEMAAARRQAAGDDG